MKLHAIFNKTTGVLLAFFSDEHVNMLPVGQFNTQVFDINESTINLARYRIEGTYPDAKLVDLFAEKKAVVTQQEIDLKYRELFYRKYENIMGKPFDIEELVLDILDNDDRLNLIRDFRKKLKDRKNQEIQTYIKSPNHIYETTEDQIQREKEIFT